jgi:DNA-binding transcriptional MerR regulator
MFDRGLMLTAQAIRRQLAAMPHDLYLIRLIHQPTKRSFPGERLWTAQQLLSLATIRFLRARNREGCDIYVHPYAQDHNAGYILVDLDRTEPTLLTAMSAQGHEPCVVLQTSPGHLQAWVHVSSTPLPPALASVQHDRSSVLQQRQRLLHREQQSLHVHVELLVEILLRNLADRAERTCSGVCALLNAATRDPGEGVCMKIEGRPHEQRQYPPL